MKKFICALLSFCLTTRLIAAEVPLCPLPLQADTSVNHAESTSDLTSGCAQLIADAEKIAKTTQSSVSLRNTSAIPSQLSIGTVYLQPITMAPAGMMRPRDQSDIHLEMDIHAKENLKSRGFAPGDWLPNVTVSYIIQKIGATSPLACGMNKTSCELMPMVASDGTHYGDNVKLAGPGFYLVTFDARTNPHFGWHTDTDSKVLGTEFVDWHFKQSYLLKWTGVGKVGGY